MKEETFSTAFLEIGENIYEKMRFTSSNLQRRFIETSLFIEYSCQDFYGFSQNQS
jgi:hypothetical protein